MRAFRFATVLWTMIAFGVSAYLFFTTAPAFDAVRGEWFSLGDAYRILAIADVLAALLTLIRPRGVLAAILALVALLGAAVVIVPALGGATLPLGLPALPQAAWTTERAVLAAAQCFAVVGTLILTARRR